MQRLVASVLIQTDGRGTRVLLRHPIAASPSNLRSIAQGLLKPEERACAMSSAGPGLVVEVVRRAPDQCVLAVSGELSVPSPGLLTRSLSKALADPGRVLVDVSRLRLGSAAAVQVFASALAGAGGWPATRLVLFGAGAELARTLTALRVTSTVPLAADETGAWLLLDRRPPVLARHLDLDRDSFSLRRARMFVRFACADWQLDPIRDDAVAVASELVTNAVQHVGPACRLTLRYRADALTR